MNVAIVGLGLIGGSMAKSIKTRPSHTVWGIDLNAETMTMARMCGAIDAPLTEENLPQADLILVAIRPGAAIEWVRQHAPQIAKSASPTSAATPWPVRSGAASLPPQRTCTWEHL